MGDKLSRSELPAKSKNVEGTKGHILVEVVSDERSKQSLWPLPLLVNLVPSSTPVTHCGSSAYLCCYYCQVCGEPQRKTSDVAEIKLCHQAALWFPWWHQGKCLPGKMQCGRFWKRALFSGQDLGGGSSGTIVHWGGRLPCTRLTKVQFLAM